MGADIKPEKAGFDADRLTRIDAWMQRYVDEGKFPGSSLLLARNGRVVHTATAGLRSVENSLPYEHDTITRIYSMTKPVTSLALMMLAERGLFHLDLRVDRILPEFRDCRALISGATATDQVEACTPPTLHQLLTHTSGLSYSFNENLLSELYLKKVKDCWATSGGLAGIIKTVSEIPLLFRPGKRWEYSIGIDVIGRVIEVVSGKPLDVFLREEIFEPLGMHDTGFEIPDGKLDRFASCYDYAGWGKMTLLDEPETSDYRHGKVSTFSGGGGLVSTLDDYFRFAEMLRLGGELDGVRLISPRTCAYMKSNHLPGDIASMGPESFAEMPMQGVGFGIGGSVVLDPARMRMAGSKGDFSWGGMASTIFWIDPVEALTCIFFTQLRPSSSYPNRAELKALVHGALVD